jgi:hypothetical protein
MPEGVLISGAGVAGPTHGRRSARRSGALADARTVFGGNEALGSFSERRHFEFALVCILIYRKLILICAHFIQTIAFL